MKKIVLIIVGIMLFSIGGCATLPEQIDTIIIENEDIVLKVGETVKLDIKIQPQNAIANELIMSSNNENVAVINGMGEVVAKGVGTATIKVYCKRGNASTTTSVKVVQNSKTA